MNNFSRMLIQFAGGSISIPIFTSHVIDYGNITRIFGTIYYIVFPILSSLFICFLFVYYVYKIRGLK